MKTLIASILAGLALPVFAAGVPPVPYPDGYRHWVHVKSMEIKPGHALYAAFGGLHHIYANPRALKGYQSGRFADGAVIVFDLLEAKTADNAMVEGPRKVLGVMHRDSRRYAATGGWGFEGFVAGDRARRAVGDKAAEACFGCHAPQKDSNYLFSTWRD
jgi:hypothetical protein